MMDPRLKQRLVGATVLTALAVIFVPMLFDEPDIGPDPRDFEIPKIPARIDRKPVQPAQALDPNDLESVESAISDSGPGKKLHAQSVVGEGVEARVDEDKESKQYLKSWVIQLGSFSKVENANQLRNQLRESKYPAYVESVDKDGKTLFRVRVGPEIDPKRAGEQRDAIEKKFGIKGIVLSDR